MTDPGELLERVEQLSARIEELADPEARELAQALVAAVIAMYGDGLRRIVETIEAAREAGATILDELSQDGAVASLLLIHDLYPVALEERVLEALGTVRPYMESHGGNVQLIGIEEGVARLALEGSCNGCAASRATLELAIKQALEEHAPDLVGLEVEGVTDPAPAAGFELPMVHAGGSELPLADAPAPRWVALNGVATALRPSELRTVEVDGAALLEVQEVAVVVRYPRVTEVAVLGRRPRGGRRLGGRSRLRQRAHPRQRLGPLPGGEHAVEASTHNATRMSPSCSSGTGTS